MRPSLRTPHLTTQVTIIYSTLKKTGVSHKKAVNENIKIQDVYNTTIIAMMNYCTMKSVAIKENYILL